MLYRDVFLRMLYGHTYRLSRCDNELYIFYTLLINLPFIAGITKVEYFSNMITIALQMINPLEWIKQIQIHIRENLIYI